MFGITSVLLILFLQCAKSLNIQTQIRLKCKIHFHYHMSNITCENNHVSESLIIAYCIFKNKQHSILYIACLTVQPAPPKGSFHEPNSAPSTLHPFLPRSLLLFQYPSARMATHTHTQKTHIHQSTCSSYTRSENELLNTSY